MKQEGLVPVLIPLSEMEFLGTILFEIATDADMPPNLMASAKRAHQRLYEAMQAFGHVAKETPAGAPKEPY
jgi:hypothetical protein